MNSTLKNFSFKQAESPRGIFILLAPLLLSAVLCSSLWAKDMVVVTTIFPLQEFAGAVGGERAQVTLLLPPGAEPHTWEPRPSDIVTLSRADIFIYVSNEMEPWVPGILKSITPGNLTVYQAGQWLPKRSGQGHSSYQDESHLHGQNEEAGEHAGDPHLWLDFSFDQTIVDNIAEAFVALDPEQRDYYLHNAQAYKAKLSELDAQYRATLGKCDRRELILGGHAAFGFLVERYGLRQIALYDFSPNAEPTPRKMAESINLAREHEAQAIFFEELVSDKLAKAIAREVGAKTLVLNPGANLSKKQIETGVTFILLMEQNLENLRDGLGCH